MSYLAVVSFCGTIVCAVVFIVSCCELIPKKGLRALAWARLKDARVLYASKRYDCAAYICGYSVELALKARICRTLRWNEFPQTPKEFKGLTSFRVHDLSTLLRLSGVETKVKSAYLYDWSVVQSWAPDMRYETVGKVCASDANDMIASAEAIVRGTA